VRDFLHSYLATALWSSTAEDDTPLDAQHGIEDFAPEALAMAERDCADFLQRAEAHLGEHTEALAGHDFWLTRNRHGAGFWDGDWHNGAELTELAHSFGETDAYVGDDGLIYFSR
jgi:hypothetical protein